MHLGRSDQYIFDGIFASARKHITAISQTDSLLPFETILLAMMLEQAKEIAALRHELEQGEMDEVTGWLFDVYDHPEGGIVLWVIADSGERLRLRMEFPITFYLAGDFKLLRAAWIFLKGKAELARTKRRDLFLGERDVMQVTLT